MSYWDRVARETADELLPILEDWYGSQVALARSELRSRLDCNNSVLSSAVRMLRLDGHLVIGDNGGYRLAHSLEEVEEYIASLQENADAIQELIDAMEKALAQRRAYGQKSLL